MKQDFSRARRGYRRRAAGTCCICKVAPAVNGQGHCDLCHAIYQRFWRVRRKTPRTLDDDTKMVHAGLELLQRRLGIGVKPAARRQG